MSNIGREIVTTLVSMYNAKANEERNLHYTKLLELSADKLQFIQNILNILKEDYNNQEKLSVSIFFKSFLNNMIMKKEIDSSERKLIFEELIRSDPSIIVHLTPCIETILFFDEADPINTQHLLETLFAFLEDISKSNEYKSDQEKIRIYFSFFKVAVNVIQDVAILSEKFNNFKDILASAADKAIELLKSSFNEANLQEAQIYSTLIYDWTVICRETTSKISKENKSHAYIDYMTSHNYMVLFNNVIFLGFPNEKVFFDSGDKRLNEAIYASKLTLIKILSQLITVVKPHLHMRNLEGSDFQELLHK